MDGLLKIQNFRLLNCFSRLEVSPKFEFLTSSRVGSVFLTIRRGDFKGFI